MDTAETPDGLNPETIDYSIVPEDQVEYTPQLCLDEAGDIIGYLVQLLPALRDPPPVDYEMEVTHCTDGHVEDMYRKLANAIFPRASKRLVQRLGHSNWQRHRNLWPSSDRAGAPGGRVHRRATKRGLTPWERKLQRPDSSRKTYSERYPSHMAESDAESSTIVSHPETVLTKIHRMDQDSTTSATDSSHHSPILDLLVVPQPPVDLTRTDQFYCPYCQSELPLTFSSKRLDMKDWAAHVYHDLKPYMCTWEDCFHEHRLYGDRGEWFQHELNFHRSDLVFFCGLCRADFSAADHLEAHLQSSHRDLSPDQYDLLKDGCNRYFGDPLVEEPCVFCGKVCQNVDELESHLGNHMEAFALATLLDDESADEEEMDGDEIVAEYIAGMRRVQGHGGDMLPVDEETHADTLIDATPVDIDVGMVDASDSHGDVEPNPVKSRDISWFGRVEDYLSAQSTLGSIPTIRHNVRARYDNFVGRDMDLERIHGHLSIPGQICTVIGRGGVGKTAIALEYLYKYESEYSYVFWVEAETPGLCAERYGSIASKLGLDEKLSDEDARKYLVKETLTKSERRWLLIFDNVASWGDISRYVPRNLPRTKGSIIITTRSSSILQIPPRYSAFRNHHAVELDVWCLDHSREFLLTSIQPSLERGKLQAHEEYDLARQVVEVVGRLPLAISMIVGYLKVSRCTLVDFLEMWEEKEEYIDKKKGRRIDIGEGDIDSTIDSLWTIGIREVRMNSRRLLDILSFLDPETIQKSLLVGDHKDEYLEFLNSSESLRYAVHQPSASVHLLTRSFSYKRMISELSGRRLLVLKQTNRGEPAYNIHRLLQQKILLDMEDYAFADAFRKSFRLIRRRFPAADPQQVPDPRTWDSCQEYIPHVFTFCRIYNQHAPIKSLLDPKPLELAELFYDAGFYVWARQTTSYDGLSFLETAERILDEIEMDQSAKIRADILCVTGLLLLNMGCCERQRGLRLLKKAWEIRKRIYDECPNGNNDVLRQNAANDYSLCLLNEHQFEEAGKLFQECRDRYLVWGPEEQNPFENSKYYGNYSIVLMWRGELDKALEFQEHALHLTEQFADRKGAYYRKAFMLACIHLQLGDIQGALDTHLEVLAARLKLYGKHHESTILSTYAVGATYHHLGDLSTAR